MLELYQTFQTYKVPQSLYNEVLDFNLDKLERIDGFSKINVFIGPNNSGKSKLMRELIKQKPIPSYGARNWKIIAEKITQIFSLVAEKISVIYNINDFTISNHGFGQIFNLKSFSAYRDLYLKNVENYRIEDLISTIETHLVTIPKNMDRRNLFFIIDAHGRNTNLDEKQKKILFKTFDDIKDEAILLISHLENFKFSSLAEGDITRVYIPSMRTLRQFAANTNIKEETRKEYKFDNLTQIYNGQDLPNEIFKYSTSKYVHRQELTEFESLLSKEFFEGKLIKLTYDNEDKVLLIKIGHEVEKPIHELGDGLQMLIILIFPFFKYKAGIIAIEEPELFIHPGLQKSFIKFLTTNSHTKNFQICITTHSNHIIDSINQSDLVSLFSIQKREKENDNSFEKVPDFVIENLAFGHENFLSLLGIHNTSVYLSNCTIWVEGITDKLYLQKFISEYLKLVTNDSKYAQCKEFKEGISYSFALSGGDSIIHWDFNNESEYYDNTRNIIVAKFCSKSLVIVDNDFGKNKNRKELLQGLLKERFIELENPEIENFLSQDVIKKTLLTYSSIVKANKSQSFPTVKHEHFKHKKIGFIIDKILLKEYPSVKTFASTRGEKSSLKSGDKFIFCEKALQFINSENLTDESKLLVELILDFVITRNAFL